MQLQNADANWYILHIPDHVIAYLTRDRGLTPLMIRRHRLGWNGSQIMIPVFDRRDRLVFFKKARAPGAEPDGPKMVCWPAGHPAELYGWENLTHLCPPFLVICEGEFDRLLLESRGIAAVSGTAGAGVFLDEWAEALRQRPNVFICYDRDDAGCSGALRVGRLLPHARLVALPEDVGPSGDVTDFFVRLGRSVNDFQRLLADAAPAPVGSDAPEAEAELRRDDPSSSPRDRSRIDVIKSGVRLEEVVETVTSLRRSGRTLVGRCPFHPDHQPSFVVYVEQQRYHCYGCGRHGDVIQFVMDAEHKTFRQALDALEQQHRHSPPDGA
jgi:hypothetical protein